jgi:CubicO group peptidase (beta-lactamase class C family)
MHDAGQILVSATERDMIRRVILALLTMVVVCASAAALWYYRPWSPYSPARIATMQQPEELPYGFRHMDEYFPSTPVPAGADSRPLPARAEPLELTYTFDGQSKTLEQFLEESRTLGLVVLKDGAIVHEQYRMGAEAQDRFTSWSVAKSFIATVVAMAVREGKIGSLDDPVRTYAPQFDGSGFADVSLADLLRMSSGVDFKEDYAADDSDVRPYFFNAFILGRNADELLLPFQRNREPGTDFHYISPNSQVLSAVLRGVYGKPLAEIVSEKIWVPLGMEADAYWLRNRDDDRGLALGYCCLNARLRDYARFGQFYLEAFQGEGLGPEVLPEDWVARLNQPASPQHKPGETPYQGRGYSYHFWLPPEHDGEFMAAGVYGQYVFIDPARDVVIARSSADPDWSARQRESAAVMQAVARGVGGEELRQETPSSGPQG